MVEERFVVGGAIVYSCLIAFHEGFQLQSINDKRQWLYIVRVAVWITEIAIAWQLTRCTGSCNLNNKYNTVQKEGMRNGNTHFTTVTLGF